MPVVIKCPCGQQLQASEADVGKQVRCPACARALIVPGEVPLARPVAVARAGSPSSSARTLPSLAPTAALPVPALASDVLAWFVAANGSKLGPYTTDQLRQMAARGQLRQTDMLWRQGAARWCQAAEVPALFAPPSQMPAVAALACVSGLAPVEKPGLGRWILREVRETGTATLGQTVRLVRYGRALWKKRLLMWSSRRAERKFGQHAYAVGVGTPEILTQIKALNEQIGSPETTRGTTRALREQRKGLLIRLADDLLAVPVPPPQVAAAHHKAQETRAAVREHQKALDDMRAKLFPERGAGWRQIGIGYALAACFLLGLTLLISGRKQGWKDQLFEGKTLPAWIALTKDSDPRVRKEATATLLRAGRPAVDLLIEIGTSADPEGRSHAAFLLGEMGESAKPAVPMLLKAMKGVDGTLRVNAATALYSISTEHRTSAIDTLIDIMRTHAEAGAADELTPLYAQMSLARIGLPAVAALAEALKDRSAVLRINAAATLGKIGPGANTAVLPLIAALKDDEAGVRATAALALGSIGEKARTASVSLEEALKDREATVRLAAVAALNRVNPVVGRLAVFRAVSILSDPDEQVHVRVQAAEVLGGIGPPASRATASMLDFVNRVALNDHEILVRIATAEALVRINAEYVKTMVPYLCFQLKRTDQTEISVAAARTLGRLGTLAKGATADLTAVLKNPNKRIRQAATEALKQVAPEAAGGAGVQ